MEVMPAYCLAEIIINSDLELPLPVAADEAKPAAVRLELGSVLDPAEVPEKAGWDWPSARSACLSYPGLGKAWIRDGEQVLLRPQSTSGSATEWRGLIIPCFAALFHQRGDLSLHASAVSIDGKAIGVMGYRGAGKSTLTAQLVDGGARFMGDDLLLTGNDPKTGDLVAYPGFSIIKLWEDAVREAGGSFSRIGRLYPDAAKDGFSPSGDESSSASAPLRCLFVLEEGEEVKVESLSRADALAELLKHTYGVEVFDHRPLPVHFQQCGDIAARVSVKRLIRPKTFACAEEVRNAVSASLREIVS